MTFKTDFTILFWENMTWHFMWIVCLADDSHEMSSLIFSQKKTKKKKKQKKKQKKKKKKKKTNLLQFRLAL